MRFDEFTTTYTQSSPRHSIEYDDIEVERQTTMLEFHSVLKTIDKTFPILKRVAFRTMTINHVKRV